MFTGASQFALVGVIGGGGSLVAGALTALLLGGRNALYGLRLSSLLRVRGARRAVAAQFVIDESAAMGIARGRAGFWATGLAVFACWNAGTAAGALGGEALSDPSAFGLDAAAPAAFLALLAPRLTGRSAQTTALAAAAAALIAAPLTPGRRARAGRGPGGAAVMWPAILLAAGGCYLLKLAGLSVPRRVLEAPRVERIADRIPIALLAALIAVSTFTDGRGLVLDERVAGLAAAGVAVVLRAPFLAVVAVRV